MKDKKRTNKSPAQLKSRLMAALAMLLVASVLMGSTTYAWLVLSIAPEVTGISTNIGANGSLEIALLNTETRQNMNNISSGKVGESLANDSKTANNAWGNLVDLNAVDYGLNNIVLMPARLDAVKNAGTEDYTVASGLLSVPTYGYDGRVIDVSKDAVSAVFSNKEFAFVPASQDYGVRAIGTSDSLTVQGSALAMAKSNVATYTNSANGAAAGSLANNGSAVFDIMVSHMLDANATFDDADMDVIMSMVSDLQSSVDYIDLALRQGLVGFTASVVDDVDQFETVRDKIIDQNKSISALLAEMDEFGEIPADFTNWVAVLETAKNDLNGAYTSCSQLTERGAPYAWEEILGALSKLMNLEGVYINDTKYSEFDKSQAGSLIGGDIVLTLAPGSGVFANVADFADDFSTIVSTMGTSVEITTETIQDPVYLAALSAAMTTLEAAGGSSGTQAVTLSATYGYALDLAFRCNASESDLLLQTSGIQRVYNDSVSATTQGGGSYMEFAVTDDIAQSILLMDAVRVGFVDDSGNLLAIAKLNTSNRQTTESVIKAPLYLYDFAISEEEDTKGMMVMGERKMTDNTITTLQKNVAKAITVIVWLDGDVVDNTMVSATEETSLAGMLNLQFASSADLIPAENSEYMVVVADRAGLKPLVAGYLETYENGQGTYTTVSWNKFAAAYMNAAKVYADEAATDSQIKYVANNLKTAFSGLTVVSKDALDTKVTDIRTMMGKTTDLARIVLLDENGNYIALGEYTQEQYDKRLTDIEIFRVDYSKNLRDEGNGIKTAIYSDESWSALASALYAAEAVIADKNATDELINGALTTLETAHKALEHGAYFLPYDFNGTLYYYAVPKDAKDDTYGKWYDAEFKRIVADKTILDLDAHAEEIDIAEIVYSDYLSWTFAGASGFVDILDDLYPQLSEEKTVINVFVTVR